MDQQQIKNHLLNVFGPDSALIKQSELFFQQCANQNLGQFFEILSQFICNESEDIHLRQISATLLKNLLMVNQYKNVWLSLDALTKKQIKETLLSTLASSNQTVRKATALAIAGLAKIDVPNKQWDDIFSLLSSATGNNQVYIQNTAVIALTYILQEIQYKDIKIEDLNSILNGFFNILNDSKDENLLFDTLSGTAVLIPYLKQIFEVETNRRNFLSKLFSYLTHPSERIRKNTMLVVIDFVKFYYDYLHACFANLLEISKTLLENDSFENKIVCYQIWLQICDIEINRETEGDCSKVNAKFAQQAQQTLIPILIKHLVIEDYSDEQWTLQRAAGALIALMSQCTDLDFTKTMIEYTGQNFNSTNEHNKHAAFFCFGSILETKHKDYMEGIINNSLPIFMDNLSQSNSPLHIKQISAWVLKKISVHYSQFLCSQSTSYYSTLIQFLANILPSSDKKTQCEICFALHELFSAESYNGNDSNKLSPLLANTSNCLISMGCNPANFDNENNVCLGSFYALNTLLEKAAPDTITILQNVFEQLYNAFAYTLIPNNIPDENMRIQFQNFISSALTSLIADDRRNLDASKFGALFANIITAFKLRRELYEEGIILIGSIALNLKGNFKSLIQEFIPYLNAGLDNIKAKDICNSSILALSDIILSMTTDFEMYVPGILNKILVILKDGSADQSLKPAALNIIGDIFFIKYPSAFQALDDVMKIIGLAMSASSVNIENSDPEFVKYLNKLRETIVETLTLIFVSCKIPEYNLYNKFVPYVPPIMNYLSTICNKANKPNKEILKEALGLVADFCHLYQKEMKNLLNREFINYITTEIKKNKGSFNESENIDQLLEYCLNEINNASN